MTTTTQKIEPNLIDRSPLKPEHKEVLDWLCRNPSRVYEAEEVAEALKRKPSAVERCFSALKHQRFGAFLPTFGPYGDVLRERKAWLPAEAPVRAMYPKIEHPPLPPKPVKVKKETPGMVRRDTEALARASRVDVLLARKESKLRHRLVVAANNQARREDRLAARAVAKKAVETEGARLAAELVASTKAVAPVAPAKKEKTSNA